MSDHRKQPKSEMEKEMSLYESYAETKKLEEKREIEQLATNEPTSLNTQWMYQPESAITFDILKNCIITRAFITQNIYKPFFSQIKNCFIRMSFPNGYAICRILDVIYGTEYSFMIGGNSFRTDRYLIIKHGSDQLKIQITYVSNSEITEEEFNSQRKSEFDRDVVKDYTRAIKLFERTLSKDEQRKTDDEKRKFICGIKKRSCFFKTDLIRKRRDALHDRKRDVALEILEVLRLFEDEDKPLGSIELNEIGRKYNLRVPGGEIDKVEIIKTRDL